MYCLYCAKLPRLLLLIAAALATLILVSLGVAWFQDQNQLMLN
jgi:hypothetical protein